MSKEKYQQKVQNSIYKKQIEEAGLRLAELREKANLSQSHLVAQLASNRKNNASADVSKTQYARIESGNCFMNIEILIAFCKFYGVSADFILFGKDSNEYNISKYFDKDDAKAICLLFEYLIKEIRTRIDFDIT